MMYHFLLYVTLTAAFLMSGCRTEGEFSASPPELNNLPDQEGFNSVLTTTEDGQITSVIKYGRMLGYSSRKQVQFHDGVELNLYEDGSHSSRILASDGRLEEQTNLFHLSGDVRVYSDNGVILKTERLLWDSKQDTVISDTFVTVVTIAGDTLHGVGFGSGKSFQNWRIERPFGVTQKKVKIGFGEEKNK